MKNSSLVAIVTAVLCLLPCEKYVSSRAILLADNPAPAVELLLNTTSISSSRINQETATKTLHDIFAWYDEFQLDQNPLLATFQGDRRGNDRWPKATIEHENFINKSFQEKLKELKTINLKQLSKADQLNHFLFTRQLESDLEWAQYKSFLIPLNQRGGIQTLDQLVDFLRFENKQDYVDYIVRLQSLDQYIDNTIELMKTGIKEGIVPPKVIMQRVPKQIRAQLHKDPKQSGFYQPFNTQPAFINDDEWQQLSQQAQTAINDTVIPSYAKFADFFTDSYLPNCSDSIALSDRNNGRAFYQHRVKSYTTTNLSIDEVHNIGLSEVKRIRNEMEDLIKKIGFNGSFTEFLTFLRTDPQFYYKTGEELETAYLATSKRIDPELVKLFGKLPRMPYGIKKIPDASAPDTTTAYYSHPSIDGKRAGYFYVNLYKPSLVSLPMRCGALFV